MSRIGLYRHRVRVEKQTRGANVGGVVQGAWALFCGPYPARFEPIRGQVTDQGGLNQDQELVRIWLRGNNMVRQITVGCRIVDDRDKNDPPRSFRILAIQNPDERYRYFTFTCARISANG